MTHWARLPTSLETFHEPLDRLLPMAHDRSLTGHILERSGKYLSFLIHLPSSSVLSFDSTFVKLDLATRHLLGPSHKPFDNSIPYPVYPCHLDLTIEPAVYISLNTIHQEARKFVPVST